MTTEVRPADGDVKLAAALEASRPEAIWPDLRPFFPDLEAPPEVDSTRLEAPICYWAVYRSGERHVTLKTFFERARYENYARQLQQHYPARLGRPDHPRGGVVLLPERNSILWGLPFDPQMPGLRRCFDTEWVAEVLRAALGLAQPEPLLVEIVEYTPERSAILRYRRVRRVRKTGARPVVAYGKVAPDDDVGLQYVIMNRFWRSPASQDGRLRLSRPLAFRREAGLLLQAPVPGKPIKSYRNTRIFLDLVEHAGGALAAIHKTNVPFGQTRTIEGLLRRLERARDELALASPPLAKTLELLVRQTRERAALPAGATPPPLVPSHGDFKWDQFLESEGRFSLIDFEFFCRAEPTLDLGYFCGYLVPSTFRDEHEVAAAEALREAFLRAYERATDELVDLRRLALYEAAVLGIRGLTVFRSHQPSWQRRTAALFETGLSRLVEPEPAGLLAHVLRPA